MSHLKLVRKLKQLKPIALGLEPLAKLILESDNPKFNPYREAWKLPYWKGAKRWVCYWTSSQYIISQIISQDVSNREMIKNQIYNYGFIVTKKKKDAEDEKEIFHMYYDHKERVNRIPNHRVLAISRAESLKDYFIQYWRI